MEEINMIDYTAETVLDEVLTALENGCQEPLYPGDERRIFGEVLASVIVAVYSKVNDACKKKLLRYATGEILDEIGDTKGCERLESVKAKTTLRFSLAETNPGEVTIPAGVRVTGDFERYFMTTKSTVIPAGSLYVDTEAESQEGGEIYNAIQPGEINVIVDTSAIPLVESVTNLTAPTGGLDEEEDDSYRERIRVVENTYSTAGTAPAYRYWALSANTTVIDATVTTPSAGVVLITPLCVGGAIPGETVLQDVLTVCSGEYVRGLTDNVQVRAPTTVEYDIVLSYVCERNKELDIVERIEGEGGAIEKYRLWQDQALSRDINPDQLRKQILSPQSDDGENLDGATRVTVTSPAYTPVGDTQVARWSGVLTVTHAVE